MLAYYVPGSRLNPQYHEGENKNYLAFKLIFNNNIGILFTF